MSYLIDTNIISEIRKGSRCNPMVTAWYETIEDEEIYLSVLVLGEVREGVERERPRDPAKAAALERWLDTLTGSYAERILPIDQAVADEQGRMSARRPVPVIDALLAATARVHRMTLVTRISPMSAAWAPISWIRFSRPGEGEVALFRRRNATSAR